MKRSASTAALLALFITSTLTIADPLHKYGNDGAWCHVDSGWLFPKDVASFARVSQPYNIDGNNDAGAEYRQQSGPQQGTAEVDVYAAESAATDATLDGAKATAARKAGEGARIESEQPFTAGALSGVKITFVSNVPDQQTNLYYFTTDQWRVKVLASSDSEGSARSLDAFVKALPWNTLGTQSGIH